MKKILLLAFGLCSFVCHSQKEGKNEIKVNLLYTIIGLPEISYERILDQYSAVGLSLAYQIDNELVTTYVITPYYRMYFGGEISKTKAKGFFIEAAAVLAKQSSSDYIYIDNIYNDLSSTTTNFGFGVAVGAKFLNKKGYVGEVFGGVSRVFGVDLDSVEFTNNFPRIGINIGKRF